MSANNLSFQPFFFLIQHVEMAANNPPYPPFFCHFNMLKWRPIIRHINIFFCHFRHVEMGPIIRHFNLCPTSFSSSDLPPKNVISLPVDHSSPHIVVNINMCSYENNDKQSHNEASACMSNLC